MVIQMRFKRTLALLAAFILLSVPARADDYGTQLFDMLTRQLSPEEMTLQLSAQPTVDGYIPWGYLEAKNAKVRGMNIRELKIDCIDAKVTPPSEWEGRPYPKVESMKLCRAEGYFTEQDVNDYLKDRLFGHDKEWRNISVRMRNGRIEATGYYLAKLALFTLKIRVDISCSIIGKGQGLYLDNIELRINTRKVAPSLVKAAIHKLQPFVDMKKFNLPLSLRKIDFRDGECRVSSMLPPRPLNSGLKWELKNGTPQE